ncbi:MAG: hypothetical protein WCY09_07490 [Candidatus Omnitrophota bacterium]
MLYLFRGRKAQAATEIAIVGSIIILVFSYLMIFSVKLRKKQLYIQKAFRAALEEARTAGTASAVITAYLPMPNIMDPYVQGEIGGFAGGAAILRSPTGMGDDSKIEQTIGSDTRSGSYTKVLTRIENEGSSPVTKIKIDGQEVFSSE